MNAKKIVIIGILILGVINWTIVTGNQSKNTVINTSNLNYQKTSEKTLNSDLPINITSNSQFEILGFPGSGIPDDPYRIEHLNFNTSNEVLVNVENTNVHFKISDCSINGFTISRSGISLTNVKYAIIENTTIKTINGDGITATNVSECSFINNQLKANNRFGILLLESSNCSIEYNNIYDNQINGVHLKDSQKINVSNNEIYNHQYGDYSRSSLFLENSSEIKIEYNSLSDNYNGIELINSADENKITNNMIFNNLKYGIRVEYSSKNTIINNTFSGNLDYGIKVTIGSNENIMQLNRFSGNKEGGKQASDDGIRNEFIGNYWTDWNNTDTNNDLIADDPYPIEGIATNSDPFPLVNLSKEARENFERKQNPPNNTLSPLLFPILLGGGIGIGYITYTNREYRKNQQKEKVENDSEEPFTEYLSEDLLNRLKPLYHKLIVGLEYIQTYFFPQPVTRPLLKATEPTTLVEYFPSGIKEDLRSGMKWRTILTLIEIAYQDPSDTNPKKLADSLNLPLPTVSREIKKLKELDYIEEFVSAQVMRDGRYRNYNITQKGYELLYTLKETLKLTITRLKEQNEVNYSKN